MIIAYEIQGVGRVQLCSSTISKKKNCYRSIQIACLILLSLTLMADTAQGIPIEMNRDTLIKIAQHGELRDVRFIENILGTKFIVNRDDLKFIEYSGSNILLSIRLTPTDSIALVNSGFKYDIAVDPYAGPVRFTVPFGIAGIQFSDIDRILCIDPEYVQLSLEGVKSVLLPKPSPPPSMSKSKLTNTQSAPWPAFVDRYEFLVTSTDRYKTSIIVDAPISGQKCSKSVSIIQNSLK